MDIPGGKNSQQRSMNLILSVGGTPGYILIWFLIWFLVRSSLSKGLKNNNKWRFQELSFDWIDAEEGAAGGTAPEGLNMEIIIGTDTGDHWLYTDVLPDGSWFADFELQYMPFNDVENGTAIVSDENGNTTVVNYSTPSINVMLDRTM